MEVHIWLTLLKKIWGKVTECKALLSTLFLKVTTDTNNNNSCMNEHILPYNFNICYRIYLKNTEINGLGMPDAIIMH